MSDSKTGKEKELELNFFLAEFEHTVTERGQMWDAYMKFLRLYVTLLSLPIPISAVFLRTEVGKTPTTLHVEPSTIALGSLFLGLMGLFFLLILIQMRFEVLLFSRSLNGLRGHIASLVNTRIDKSITLLPVGHTNEPGYWEPFRQMGLIITLGSVVNSIYVLIFFRLYFGIESVSFYIFIFVSIIISMQIIYFIMARFRSDVQRPMRHERNQ